MSRKIEKFEDFEGHLSDLALYAELLIDIMLDGEDNAAGKSLLIAEIIEEKAKFLQGGFIAVWNARNKASVAQGNPDNENENGAEEKAEDTVTLQQPEPPLATTQRFLDSIPNIRRGEPDFELLRLIKTCLLLRAAYDADPRDSETRPLGEAMLNEVNAMEKAIARMPATTPEGVKIKAAFAWNELEVSNNPEYKEDTYSDNMLMRGAFRDVLDFIDRNSMRQAA